MTNYFLIQEMFIIFPCVNKCSLHFFHKYCKVVSIIKESHDSGVNKINE